MKKILTVLFTLYSLALFAQSDLGAPLYYIGIPNANYRFDEGLQIDDSTLLKGVVMMTAVYAVGGATDSLLSIDPATGELEKRPQSVGAVGWELTGNAGTTAGTNFIGTTDSIDFVTKTKGIERYRTTAAGLTGIGIAVPFAWQHYKAAGYTTPMFRWESPDGILAETTKLGEWNNTTAPLVIDFTIGNYPNLQNIFPGCYLKVGTEIMRCSLEVGTVRTLIRAEEGTTAVAHANGEAITQVFPNSMVWRAGDYFVGQDSPGALGINCVPDATIDVQKMNIGKDLLKFRLGVSDLFSVNAHGRLGINLIATPMSSTACIHIGASAPVNILIDGAQDFRWTSAFSSGGAFYHTGGGIFAFETTNGICDIGNNVTGGADLRICGNTSGTAGKGFIVKSKSAGNLNTFSQRWLNATTSTDTSIITMLLPKGQTGHTTALITDQIYEDAGFLKVFGRETGLTGTSASGVWTPTLFNVTNIAASTAYECQWLRVDSTVTCSGKVDIDVTLGAASELGMSLPIASALANEQNLGGTASSAAAASLVSAIRADATNDRAAFVFTAVSLTNDSYFFEFTYRIK